MKSEEPQVHTSNQTQPSSNGTNLSTSMSYILQKVKRIREMLEIPFLTKQNPDDQLSFEGTSTLLQTGYFERDEQTPFSLLTDDLGPSDYNSVDPCLFQGWPTLPLTEEDTNWGDCPDDASDISEDWDDYCPTQGDDYSMKKGVGFVKWEENVFGANEVHDQINNVGHVIEGPQICLNITPEEHREEMKQAARKARMEIINNLDPESREKLAKQEF
jgi:hypothetical protein